MLQRSWSNIVAISCIVIAGVVEALQQALNGAPNVKSVLPNASIGPWINYVPLVLVIVACLSWLYAHWIQRDPERAPAGAGPTIANQQQQASGMNTTKSAQYINADEFYRRYDNALLRQAEQTVRIGLSLYRPEDREDVLVRAYSTLFWTNAFDKEYLVSFGSSVESFTGSQRSA